MPKNKVPSRWGAKTPEWVQENVNTVTEKTSPNIIFTMWYLLKNGMDCKTKAIAAQGSTHGMNILATHLVHAKRMLRIDAKNSQSPKNKRNTPTSRANFSTYGSCSDEDYEAMLQATTPTHINSSEDVDSIAVEAIERAATYHETRAATLRATAEALQPDFGSI